MNNFSEHYCRLCLSFEATEKYELIDNFTRDIFTVLSLKLKFDEKKTYVMCSTCSAKLKAALEFKATCLATGDTLYPYMDSEKELQVDLREIYMKENENKQRDLLCGQKICSLCMQLARDEFIDIRDHFNAIHKFVPEIDIGVIIDPILCKGCFHSLNIHNNFLDDCLEIEKKVENICDNIGTSGPYIKSLNSSIGTDAKLEVKKNAYEMASALKSESIDIKFEVQQERSQDAEEDNHLSGKIESDPIVDRDLPQSQILNTQNSSEIQLKCKDLKSHNVVQSTSGQMYKYNEARYKTHLAKNIQTRRRLLRARILKCEECNYQAKRMRYLRIHQLRHVEYKGAQMYMCDKCEYQSKIKVYFTRHVSKHKDT